MPEGGISGRRMPNIPVGSRREGMASISRRGRGLGAPNISSLEGRYFSARTENQIAKVFPKIQDTDAFIGQAP